MEHNTCKNSILISINEADLIFLAFFDIFSFYLVLDIDSLLSLNFQLLCFYFPFDDKQILGFRKLRHSEG